MNGKKLAAEAIGTFWLTFGGCGSAVIAPGVPQVGIGMLGVALAFGLTLLTMAYAIGHVSGCPLVGTKRNLIPLPSMSADGGKSNILQPRNRIVE